MKAYTYHEAEEKFGMKFILDHPEYWYKTERLEKYKFLTKVFTRPCSMLFFFDISQSIAVMKQVCIQCYETGENGRYILDGKSKKRLLEIFEDPKYQYYDFDKDKNYNKEGKFYLNDLFLYEET